ncbi:MAG: prepilin-type N-terminal cleavage/methylation domain-containing protein [Candidatus Omnitrophota bacterium]
MKIKKINSGFTLIEVLVAAGILVFCLCGLLVTYIGCFILNETSRNTTIALSGARTKMEELKQETFDNLLNHNGEVFDVTGFTLGRAKGRVEVTDIAGYTDLREIRIIVSFRQSQNRLIGEDINLNGLFDAGEDLNANNRLDSPIEVVSLVSR